MSEHLTLQRIDTEIPELAAGCRDAVEFAAFCQYLTDYSLGREAEALVEAAQALLAATRGSLAGVGPQQVLPAQHHARTPRAV